MLQQVSNSSYISIPSFGGYYVTYIIQIMTGFEIIIENV